MNAYIQKIKSLLKKTNSRPESYARKMIRPIHDWSILLSVATILLLLSGLVAYYFYYEIRQGNFFITKENQGGDTARIDMQLINKAVDDIKTRQAQTVNIETDKLVVPADPSL